jgi:hypothetical protein
MYFRNVVGTGSYTTSTTNMYNKDFTYFVVVTTSGSAGAKRTKHTFVALTGRHHQTTFALLEGLGGLKSEKSKVKSEK